MLNKLYLTLRNKAVELDQEIESAIDFGKLMDEVRDRKGVVRAIWLAVNYLYF